MDISVATARLTTAAECTGTIAAWQKGDQHPPRQLNCSELKKTLYRHMLWPEPGYPITGSDTLTIGEQEDWLWCKLLAASPCEALYLAEQSIQRSEAGAQRRAYAEALGKLDSIRHLLRLKEARDADEFDRLVQHINWDQCSAFQFKQAVRWALAVGAHLTARQLAKQGAERHPGDAEMQDMARILAPPRLVQAGLPPDPAIAANRRWLALHASEYRGRLIALRDGVLVATADTVAELKEKIHGLDRVFVTRVA